MGRGKQKQKPFDVRQPPCDLEGDGGYRSHFPDVTAAPRPSTLILPPRAAQENRRAVSDPVYGTKEPRKFLDPIEEVLNEYRDEGRSTPGPRVRFRSKSVAAVVPSFLRTGGRTPTTGDGDRAEGPQSESSVSIFGMEVTENSLMQPEGGELKDADNWMDTGELLGDFGEAFRGPLPYSTLRRAASSNPIHRIKGILDTLVPESHSTPATSKSSVAPRRVSSAHPSPPPPSKPPNDRFNNPSHRTTGIGLPRPAPFNTSFLPPHTQKVARGQLVILPSKALLVDFREGERRQGREGVEVLTISPNGEEVCIVQHDPLAFATDHPGRLACSVLLT